MTASHVSDDIGDDELAAQLAHLDALERRELFRRVDPSLAPMRSVQLLPVQPRWPVGISPAPEPTDGLATLQPLINWLEFACSILASRFESNAAELERLRSQWVHVRANVERLRPDELDDLIEGQARVRETIANDAALHDVLRAERQRLVAWSDTLTTSVGDPALIRRLLDDSSRDRRQVAGHVVDQAVDVLSGVLLDLEVVQRALVRDPGQSTLLIAALRERVTATTERLRDHPVLAEVEVVAGEPLRSALGRIIERYRGRVESAVQWRGVEILDPDLTAVMAGVVQECIGQVATEPGATLEIRITTPPAGPLGLRVVSSSSLLGSGGAPTWLVRARARAALVGGRMSVGTAGSSSAVEVHFPAQA